MRTTNLSVSRSGIEHARTLSEEEIGQKIERGFRDQNRGLGEQVDHDFQEMHDRCKKGDTKYDTGRVVCDPRKPRKI